MNKWAGWIITLAGTGHTLGSLIEAAPAQARSWFDGSLWGESGYRGWTDATAGFWYSGLSFGPPLLLLGVTTVWCAGRGLTPPPLIAWGIAVWVVVTFVVSGPSPLLVLLVAAGLMMVAARRERDPRVRSVGVRAGWTRRRQGDDDDEREQAGRMANGEG